MDVLGIDVSSRMIRRWIGWFAPAEQPFRVSGAAAEEPKLTDDRTRLTMEVSDRFELYGLRDDEVVAWLDRDGARRLPREVRRDQPNRHVWPDQILGREAESVVAYVEHGRRPSRHREVPERVWRGAHALLPAARRLAGTFPSGSGPNCFGTVMAAAGEIDAAAEWVQTEPFEAWLADRAVPGGVDEAPGTLLVWRGLDGGARHAAVTLGEGWALHKPSQGWMSPVKVLSVRQAILSSRCRGQHLHRYRLSAAAVGPHRTSRRRTPSGL